MKPEIGDEVKIFFKNSLQVEGKVNSWEKEIVLSSKDDSHFMVINDYKNILMYKISKNKQKEILEQSNEEENAVIEGQEFKSDFNPNSNIYTLAKLHQLKLEEEKKEIAQKIRQHQATDIKKVEYGLPGFFEKQESE